MKTDTEKKGNFKIALDEILKRNSTTPPSDVEVSELKVTTKIFEVDEKKEERELKKLYSDNRPLEATIKSEATIISEGTIIEGSIKSKNDIIIRGRVIGDVENEKSISISGHVEGNVKSNNTVTLEGSITGNSSSSGLLTIAKESKISGDVNCQRLETDGCITGNITATETVYIGSNSIITGNIVAKSLSIKEGAKIKGLFEISSESK